MDFSSPYKISVKAEELISRMILLTGTARSGTTIMGKLLHSTKEVEYAYEPPMMLSLIPMIRHINKSHWKLLFETYCYEELMLGYIVGRNLNFNVNDDSYILKVKTKEEIEKRLNAEYRKKQLEHKTNNHVLCIKIPDITGFIPKIQSYYPGIRVIIIIRSANDVINSLVKKGWYDDISIESSDVVWPFRIYNGCKVPFWVEHKKNKWWCAASHIERAAYNHIWNMESMEAITDKIIIRYRDLIEKPETTILDLFGKLSLTPGGKTSEILRDVAPRDNILDDMVGCLPKNMRKKIVWFEERYQLS